MDDYDDVQRDGRASIESEHVTCRVKSCGMDSHSPQETPVRPNTVHAGQSYRSGRPTDARLTVHSIQQTLKLEGLS
jgi:hypothetical protein